MAPRATLPSKSATSLEARYVEPGRGRIDLTKHKGGQEGLRKCVEDFTAAHPIYVRKNLELCEKVVLVGDPSVGKTRLVLRLKNDTYKDDYQHTIGVDFFWERYVYGDYEFTLHIWDTAGLERYRSMSKAYYRGAQACIASFDLGVPETLAHVKQWVAEVRKENPHNQDLCVFLAGCKSDMFHVVASTHAEHVAAELQAEYFEVSSKSGFNVRTLFDRVAIVLFERALLRASTEWAEENKKSTSKIITPQKQSSMERFEDSEGDPGSGKGTENWKEVKKTTSTSHCCGTGRGYQMI